MMTQISREQLRKELLNKIAYITFEKVDGSTRQMCCTLKEELLPSSGKDITEEKKVKAINNNILAVWDLDNGAWKSFRIDSIKDVVYSTKIEVK